ncbi:MAG: DAK2 domain-containing protein [Anaerolineales bacterium]|nr:DAK2 domain-containing protein [Anaerolineales bacterium]
MSKSHKDINPELRARLLERALEIDGSTLSQMVFASLDWLRTNQQLVNSLNVFPVPDGDTGTNMVLTMQSAVDEIVNISERSVGDVASAIAQGALMGARGNSGVILSQLWRGFARILEKQEMMSVESFASSLQEASETAYKGVVRPVEGTILTVSKDIAAEAQNALENGTTSVLELLEQVVEAADESVERTPDLLPVLKDAGVVDSGGKGLFFILEGMLRAAYRLPLDQPLLSVQPLSMLNLDRATEAIEPGQDWEVIIDFSPEESLDLETFYGKLEEIGTSIQVGEGDGMYRMHIHVPDEKEYKPIDYIKGLGTITNIAIENLMVQMAKPGDDHSLSEIRLQSVEPGEIAVVAVAPGPGLARVFASLGVTALVEGGQTMNPSTQEIMNAFENLPTDQIVILPNNKNIILAAQQATELTVKKVVVIPTVSIPQGIAAMFAWNSDGNFESTAAAMETALESVQSAAITTATRSVEIDNVNVEMGQVIGLLNGKLACSGQSIEEVLTHILKEASTEEYELITLYYGEDLSAMQANQLADIIRESYPKQEIEVLEGAQPHYQLILSIE